MLKTPRKRSFQHEAFVGVGQRVIIMAMALSPELADYLQKARAAGLSDDAIRRELLKVGWTLTDVNEVLPPVIPPLVKPNTSPEPPLPSPFLQQTTPIAAQPVETPKRRNHLAFVITVFLLILAGELVYYFLPQLVGVYMKFTEKPIAPVQYVPPQNNVPINPVEPAATSTQGWNTYRNEVYGFEIELSPSWEGYRVSEEPGVIRFGIKDQDYVFGISMLTKSEYSKCTSGELCPVMYIAQNNAYVFTLVHAQDYTEKIINTPNLVGQTVWENIISTFKFISPALLDVPTKVLSPNGGETFTQGQRVVIRWAINPRQWGSNPLNIDIDLLSGPNKTPINIVTSLSNVSSYVWTVAVPAGNYVISVHPSSEGLGGSHQSALDDWSDSSFSVTSTTSQP